MGTQITAETPKKSLKMLIKSNLTTKYPVILVRFDQLGFRLVVINISASDHNYAVTVTKSLVSSCSPCIGLRRIKSATVNVCSPLEK